MDIENAKKVVKWIFEGKVKVLDLGHVPVPSPFAHNIVLEGLSDVILMEDKRYVLERLYEMVNQVIVGKK